MYDDEFDDDDDIPSEDVADEATICCPACGMEIYEDSPQCPHCGEYVTSSTSRFWGAHPVGIIVFNGLGLVAVLVALFVMMFRP